jgi:tRNA(fMet)-specific endonuclease VapC
MIYLPDTNCFSVYFSNKSPALSVRLNREMTAGKLVLSVMVLAELEFGAFKAREVSGTRRFMETVTKLKQSLPPEPLQEDFVLHYSRTRLHLECQGNKIGDRDLIIASHALALGATIITRNLREFQRIPGLNVENWQTEV